MRAVLAPNGRRAAYAAATALALISISIATAAGPGSLDRSLGGDGKKVVNFNRNSFDRAVDMVVQRDGKILVLALTESGDDFFATLFRLKPDGSPDRSFGKNGKKRITMPAGYAASAEAIALDGNKILIGLGDQDSYFAMRLGPGGALDRSFGSNGVTGMNIGDASAADVMVGAGNKVIVSGYVFNEREDWALVRFDRTGTMDPSFSGDAKAFVDFSGDGSGDDRLWDATPDRKKIIAVGEANRLDDLAFARLTATGGLDNTFSGDGRVTFPVPSEFALLHEVVPARNGYVAAGDSGTSGNYMLVKVNRKGQLVGSFGTNGVRVLDRGNMEGYRGLVMQPDGKIVAVGQSCGASAAPCKLAVGRHRPNGTFDPSFGQNGLVLLSFAPAQSVSATAVAWQTDGRILAVGTTQVGIGGGIAASSAAAGPVQRIGLARLTSGACGILGDARGNVLIGTPARDHICGGGGNDRLRGGVGNDVLVGGPGRDLCEGGPGKDTLRSCER